MISKVRFLIMPIVASATLWCSAGLSANDVIASDDSELNLSDEGVADDFFGYWNTYGCALMPCAPFCAPAALPYFGPAWYNGGGWRGGFGAGWGRGFRGGFGRHFRGR